LLTDPGSYLSSAERSAAMKAGLLAALLLVGCGEGQIVGSGDSAGAQSDSAGPDAGPRSPAADAGGRDAPPPQADAGGGNPPAQADAGGRDAPPPQADGGGGNPPAQADAGGTTTEACNTVQTVSDDMSQPPEATPKRPWTGAALVEVGNDAPSWANSLTGWGEVYRDTTDANDTNTKVEVRNMRVSLLSRSSGQWRQLNSTAGVGYGGYAENYSSSAPLEEVTTMSDGGIAAKIPHGSVFHFWPDGSNVVNVDTGDIGGIFVAVQAKLLVGNASQPDDTAIARYTVDVGADYYGNGQCCAGAGGEIGQGRTKLVTTEWRWFNFITVPVSQIASNPPPVECGD
jgi:hypothetical protein